MMLCEGLFEGCVMMWYGCWLYKFENVVKYGVVVVIIVYDIELVVYLWVVV